MKLNVDDIYNDLLEEIKSKIANSKKKYSLMILRVGENKGNISFEKSIIKQAKSVGIEIISKVLEKNVDKSDIFKIIDEANLNDKINGILILTPIESNVKEKEVLERVKLSKDVEGLNSQNLKNVFDDNYNNVSTTASATFYFLKNKYNLSGKDILIINRSNLIGKPLIHMLISEDATVTIAHSKTKNLDEKIKSSDIIISGIGKPNFFNNNEFKENAVVIDLGYSMKDGKYYGDFDYDYLEKKNIDYLPSLGTIGKINSLFILKNTYLNGERNV